MKCPYCHGSGRVCSSFTPPIWHMYHKSGIKVKNVCYACHGSGKLGWGYFLKKMSNWLYKLRTGRDRYLEK